MFFDWRRRSRGSQSADERLQADVLACARVLGRKLPPLARRYSMQVFTVALAMHLRATLALALREREMTEAQAARLVAALLRADEEEDLTPKDP